MKKSNLSSSLASMGMQCQRLNFLASHMRAGDLCLTGSSSHYNSVLLIIAEFGVAGIEQKSRTNFWVLQGYFRERDWCLSRAETNVPSNFLESSILCAV